MLKRLLGQWKAHRRKPTLLPEDAEIQINDPSRVNPLYEDSEGSIASSHLHSEIDPHSFENPRPHTGDVDLDLVDISVPIKDPSESAEEAIDHINRVLDGAFDNESVKSVDRTKSTPELNNELTNPTPVEKEIKNELPQAITKLIERASIVNAQQIQAASSSSDLTKKPDSSHGETKEQVSKDQTHRELSHSERTENNPKEEQKENAMVPGTSLKSQQPSEQFATPSTSEIKKGGDARLNNKLTESEAKNNMNLKTRAIDELIKKFQGQPAGDGPPLQNVSSFLHSPNRKEIPKVKSPLFKTEVKNPEPESERKKESLSTIFKFPPPPPAEPIKSYPNDTKDNSKQTKTESSKQLSKVEDSGVKKEGTTRSDSSLSRNITVSSRDTELAAKTEDLQSKEKTKPDSKKNEQMAVRSSIPPKLFSPNPSNIVSTNEIASKKETKPSKETVPNPSKSVSATEKSSLLSQTDSKPLQPNQSSLAESINTVNKLRKDSKVSNSGPKPKIEKQTRNNKKQSDGVATIVKSPEQKNKLESLKAATSLKEIEQAKTQSEDSGITRGDQVFSESSPEVPKSEGRATGDGVPQPSPPKVKHPKEKRTLHTRGKSCKRCKKSRDENSSLKRGQCDDYYDVVTGKRRPHKGLHSESWASDLSWEERELIRRLRRSRRGTMRSDAPSTKSRHSRKHENGHFRRHHVARRSISDDSTFNGSSMCSCDDCWLFLVKDYAYGRASLRAMPPNQMSCTCRPIRPEFLGRKVKFRSETIHEGSQSVTSATPTIPEEPSSQKEDSGDTPTSDSNLSSASQEEVISKDKANGKTDKKSKNPKESYRLVTPWELEEWDLAMRRHLLMKRRKRARYMGFMALAMVVFIGLVVAVLMVYLRRKVL